MKKFLAICFIGVAVCTGYKILELSDRIQKIENKLGGPGIVFKIC